MLLTLTYRGNNTQDLGYLLHKNPHRPQTIEFGYGLAHIFYPTLQDNITTAALLLDINPIDLVRTSKQSIMGLFDYVNDRPYVASSFLCSALSRVFSTAMSGRCNAKQELANSLLDLEATIQMVACKNGEQLIRDLFEPLNYQLAITNYPLDVNFPSWGNSNYFTITLKGNVKLSTLLNQIYILIPVLDNDRHYFIGNEEVEKLINKGEGWLVNHPKKDYITARYLRRQKNLIDAANNLLNNDDGDDDESEIVSFEKTDSLHEQRLNIVVEELKRSNAKSILDLGCGSGKLIRKLIKEPQFAKITGVDVSLNSLKWAMEKVKFESMAKDRIELFLGSLTYADKRFKGHDAVAVVEVLEHISLDRLPVVESLIFEYCEAATVIITTPNIEYNSQYINMKPDELRHDDHRFEWNRAQFIEWCEHVSKKFNYHYEIKMIGDINKDYGSPTQMGVFKK